MLNLNPNMIMQMMQTGMDPKAAVMQILQNGNIDPNMAQSLIQMGNNGDMNGIMNFGRNVFKEKGKDFDTELNKFGGTRF